MTKEEKITSQLKLKLFNLKTKENYCTSKLRAFLIVEISKLVEKENYLENEALLLVKELMNYIHSQLK